MPERNGLITTAELAAILNQPELRLFDCTTYLEYQVLATFTKGPAAVAGASPKLWFFLCVFNGLLQQLGPKALQNGHAISHRYIGQESPD